MKRHTVIVPVLLGLAVLGVASLCAAQPNFNATAETSVLGADSLVKLLVDKSKSWIPVLQGHARGLFAGLALIQLGWIGISSILGGGRVETAVRSLGKEVLQLAFFATLIDKGPDWGMDIIASLQQVGREAAHAEIMPQKLINGAYDLCVTAMDEMSVFDSPVYGLAMGLGLLVMFLQLVAISGLTLVGWAQAFIVLSAGTIVLGLGGSVWTRSIAAGYLKNALSAGLKLMTLELIASILFGEIDTWIVAAKSGFGFPLLLKILCSGLLSLILLMSVPSYVSSMVTAGGVMGVGESLMTSLAKGAAMFAGMRMLGSGGSASSSSSATAPASAPGRRATGSGYMLGTGPSPQAGQSSGSAAGGAQEGSSPADASGPAQAAAAVRPSLAFQPVAGSTSGPVSRQTTAAGTAIGAVPATAAPRASDATRSSARPELRPAPTPEPVAEASRPGDRAAEAPPAAPKALPGTADEERGSILSKAQKKLGTSEAPRPVVGAQAQQGSGEGRGGVSDPAYELQAPARGSFGNSTAPSDQGDDSSQRSPEAAHARSAPGAPAPGTVSEAPQSAGASEAMSGASRSAPGPRGRASSPGPVPPTAGAGATNRGSAAERNVSAPSGVRGGAARSHESQPPAPSSQGGRPGHAPKVPGAVSTTAAAPSGSVERSRTAPRAPSPSRKEPV